MPESQVPSLPRAKLHNPSREGEKAEQIVTRHIELLHKYNETKDATQVSVMSVLEYNAYSPFTCTF